MVVATALVSCVFTVCLLGVYSVFTVCLLCVLWLLNCARCTVLSGFFLFCFSFVVLSVASASAIHFWFLCFHFDFHFVSFRLACGSRPITPLCISYDDVICSSSSCLVFVLSLGACGVGPSMPHPVYAAAAANPPPQSPRVFLCLSPCRCLPVSLPVSLPVVVSVPYVFVCTSLMPPCETLGHCVILRIYRTRILARTTLLCGGT